MANLKELSERVFRDLSVGISAVPSITFSAADREGYVEILLQDESGMGVGFLVDPSASEAEVLYEMAYRIPDAYVEFYAVGLPVVPGTERPATPEIVSSTVVWKDPAEKGTWSCPVGQYGRAWERRHEEERR
ncbi:MULTISPECIES: hypothetical protein [Streptomyces]|uniref:hypothetical protein n=1 Tax=Streptomyces TaxID=1883 RepID=UPI0013BDDC98|nr:hypothetical protein [Streptomyces sennicomposti]MBY8869097.1 hypothetical protein [Streptomyces sennicomposti]MYX42216.1 hypothetical protein [Streptomyces sp. SID89]NED71444.1 hypothetical protein [Streptomyces sp. SID9944]